MLSESKVRSQRPLRAGARFLMAGAFTAFLLAGADPSPITGTWKADVSKTTPPDDQDSALTLTIEEIGVRTYSIRFDSQTTDRGVVSEEMTIRCDEASRPLSVPRALGVTGESDSAVGSETVFCGRSVPISIQIRQGFKTVKEHVFRAIDGNSLSYTKTVDGHDRAYVFTRQ